MLIGMTGYGNVQFVFGHLKGTVEIKSQNHRYFDFVCYVPGGFGFLESKIRDVVQKNVRRGRVSVAVKITEKNVQSVHLNKRIVKEYLKEAKQLQKEFSLDNSLALADIISLPGVISTSELSCDMDQLWTKGLAPVVSKALRSLLLMRQREGRSLAREISAILKRMSIQVKTIETRTKSILKEQKKTLSPEEFTSFQKGYEISEEITRLKHYIAEFGLLVQAKADVGKKMDFVAQEMQRETNTIGSKVQDQVVSNAVIALKSKVEKLREQAQNIE